MSDDDDRPLTKSERDLLQKLAERALREEETKRNELRRQLLQPQTPYKHIAEKFDLSQFTIHRRTPAELKDFQDERDAIGVPCPLHNAGRHEPCCYKSGAPKNCADRVRRWRDLAAMREEERAREGRLELAEKLRRAGVPERHLRMVETGQWKDLKSLRLAKKFYASNHQGLMLAGDTGRGKSGAACYLASLGPRRRPGRVLWVRASTLGSIDLYPRSEKREQEAIDEEQPRRRRMTWDDIVDAQLKIIDDLGTGQLVPDIKFCDRLTDVLAASFDNDQEVIMTYNGDKADFQAIVPKQIWDRVAKWCMWEETGGDSLRE